MELSEAADLVESQALGIGVKSLSGKKMETFDNSVLRVDDSDIEDHVDMQASGQLFYGMLVRKALESVKDAQLQFDNWYTKIYDKCNEHLKAETGIKRPNKVDVENKVKSEYGNKYKRLVGLVTKKEYVYERLNLWYSAWVTKGFGLSDLSARRSRQIGKNTRKILGRAARED